ncbi:hypothetical protein BDV36DRAFT_308016 [Aspergillus pseudocaelatus]|uniref:Serine protein kinase n=1 Tax=Aspergillus pseudocaelatus TaxID=1825620 RepID=A0ABQ6WRS7_9EURO|nr:hypothetical protein BDV36DRAFT_308016 [Aspergillus pseudocaelatus]
MPAKPLPDPDTVKYPLSDSQLLLSVSEDSHSPEASIKTPYALYVEQFSVTGDLKAENQHDPPGNRFGIFASELYGPEVTPKGCKIAISGKAGDDNHPDGYNGGNLQIYVEHIDPSAAEKLSFYSDGGAGLNRDAVTGQETGPAGGNGGNGGKITVIMSSKFQEAFEVCVGLYKKLQDEKQVWPRDLQSDAALLVALVNQKEIGKAVKLPDSVKTKESMLKTSRETIQNDIYELFDNLQTARNNLTGTIQQHMSVHGGLYGIGGMGTKARGPPGAPGKVEVAPQVYRLDQKDKILDGNVCFAHPTQCRMLLDMGNLLWFCGSEEDKARASVIFNRLVRRLAFLGVSEKEAKISQTKLAQAYRDAEPSLYILSNGDKTQEPISFSLLRGIKNEAEANLASLLSGNNSYGKSQENVPRGSFKFYEGAIRPMIETLEKAEKTYLTFLRGEMDAQQKKEAIRDRQTKCTFRKGLVDDQIKEEKNDLTDNFDRIQVSDQSIKPAKESLLREFEKVKDKIKLSTSVSFDDLMSALSQIIFVHGSAPMVILQGANLANTALTKLESDSGIKVERKLLLREVKDMSGTIDGLGEGFKVLKDGGVDFDDPGATKLCVAAAETEKLLGEFHNVLGDDMVKEVKKRFDDYIEIVQQRNTAVLGYTKAVSLLIKCQTELDSLAVEQIDISRQQYDELGADHPTMTAFMKKLYTDSIHTTQNWLHTMQLAYQFVALDKENYIGKAMEGFKFSQFNASTLENVYIKLSTQYNSYKESMGRDPQTYKELPYTIPDRYVRSIKLGGTDGVVRTVPIPVVPPTGTPNPFDGMIDIRLLKVRVFLDGAKTSNGYLDITLKHQGTETILNRDHTRFDFQHAPLPVRFKYNMKNPHYPDHDTVDGDIGSATDETYSKVGPFTNWTIQILPQHNPGLDLSDVTAARFEFCFNFYATT